MLPPCQNIVHMCVQGELVSDMRYLASVVTQCFTAFGELLALHKRFAELSGGVSRCVRVCVRVRARARARACACACVCVCARARASVCVGVRQGSLASAQQSSSHTHKPFLVY